MAWWSFGARYTDDRGRAVDVARAAHALKMESASNDREPELEEIWRRNAGVPLENPLTARIDPMVLVLGLAAGAMAIVAPMAAPMLGIPQSVMGYAWPVAFIALIFAIASIQPTRGFGKWIEVYTYYGRCAQCLSSLRGIAPAGDGCVVCPECAAAWRASRLAPASVLDGLRLTDAPPTPEKPTPDHRDGRGWTWPPKPVRDTVYDAYARPVLLAAADLSNLSAEERAEIPPAVFDELRHVAGHWMDRVLAVVLRLGATALCLWFGYVSLQRALPFKFTSDSALAVLGVAMATVFAGFFASRLPRYFRRATVTHVNSFMQVMLTADRCPSCVGSLAGVEPGEHGVRRCPRCGAEWAPAGRVVARESGAYSRAR
ncbi:MAG: hypothetical protein K2X32_13770 [Phycisphaerales bacterium]|nr:hypothetical protein [Phycisphaerales bacterium]